MRKMALVAKFNYKNKVSMPKLITEKDMLAEQKTTINVSELNNFFKMSPSLDKNDIADFNNTLKELRSHKNAITEKNKNNKIR